MRRDLRRLGDSARQVSACVRRLVRSFRVFLSSYSLTQKRTFRKKQNETDQSQFREARRARAGAPTSSRFAERGRELVFARDQRYPPLPRAVRVPDGAADRRRVQVMAQGAAVRNGHDEARQRPRAGLPLALAPRRSDAERPRRVRLRAGEDGVEEEAVDGEAHLAVAQRSVRCAREHLRARVVHLSLPALCRARRGCDRARRIHTLEGCCCILRRGVRYVSLVIHHPPFLGKK